MDETSFYDRMKVFTDDLLLGVYSVDPSRIDVIKTELAGYRFNPHAYYDFFFEVVPHRGWLWEEGQGNKLQFMRKELEFMEPLVNGNTLLDLTGLFSSVSLLQDKKKLSFVTNKVKGFWGELVAIYCLTNNDVEALPFTFVKNTNKGNDPGDILIFSDPKGVLGRKTLLDATVGRSKTSGSSDLYDYVGYVIPPGQNKKYVLEVEDPQGKPITTYDAPL